MNYRHIYHAGNFADVMKHIILVALLEKLKEKDKAFTVLDAFAGIGIYDLESLEAQKTGEYKNGIDIVLKSALGACLPPSSIMNYISVVRSLNMGNSLNLYPGSPYIIAHILRKQDDLIASELHLEDYKTLKYNIKGWFNNTSIHHLDAYNAIKAFLPPKNNRGLVLLDAAFEVKNEYLKIIEALKLIKKRFSGGTVMIWYPIKDTKLIKEFYTSLSTTGYSEFLKIEFEIDNQLLGMNKCGVLIANPPFIHDDLEKLFHYLTLHVYDNRAKSLIKLIKI